MIALSLLLLVVGLSASVTVLNRELRLARERGQHWFEKANEHESDAAYYRSLLGWLKSKAPVVTEPEWAYTISRPYITPTGDRATYSTLEEIMRP